MSEARKTAKSYALFIMRQVYGWEENPKTTGPDGRQVHDFDEWDRQFQERDATFEQFTRWRVDYRKELAAKGKKLPPIYVKDKATGHVSVPHSEFEAQFRNFLDRRDHPEKYIAQEQQQAKPSETPQEQPEPVKPQKRQPEWQKPAQETLSPPSQADQERQKIASQRSALMDELQRINAANERRWQEQEQDGEEDAIVKS